MIRKYDDVCESIYALVKEMSEKEGGGEVYEILDQFLEYIRERVETKICTKFA